MGIVEKIWVRRNFRKMTLPFGAHLMEPFMVKLKELKLKLDRLVDNKDGTITFCYFASDTEEDSIKYWMDKLKEIGGIND